MTTPSTAALEAQVTDFIVSNFHVGKREAFTSATSLLDTGIVDSTGYLEIFQWIDTDFHVSVDPAEMDPSNFGTVAAIASYLHRKLG